MRIVFNTAFDEGTRAVAQANEALTEAQRQVSSGRRLNRPSDDPLGATAAINGHASLSQLDTYSAAADTAAYRLGVADNALSDMITQLTTAQSAALAARGSFQTQAQRDAARQQILAVRDALISDINTSFQGEYLFSGAEVKTQAYQVGSGYQGDSATSRIEVENGRSVASTFDGSRMFDLPSGSASVDIIAALTQLAADIASNNQAGIATGVTAIQDAYNQVTTTQSDIGNQLRTIDDGKLRISSERTSLIARLSSIEDADLAKAAASLSQAETSYRAALQSLARTTDVSLMDYMK
jgi:flagellar hook-associated protein 3 FlgL